MKKKVMSFMFGVLMMVLALSTAVFADTTGNGAGGGGGGTGASGTGTGNSYTNTGYLLYLTDENGNHVSDVKFVTSYTSVPSADAVRLLSTRIGDGSVQEVSRTDILWGMSPFDKNGVGKGGAIKNWLLTKENDQYNVVKTIEYYFSPELAEQFSQATADKPVYLIVEAVSWHNIYQGAIKLSGQIVATAPNMAEFNRLLGNSPDFICGRYDNINLPTSLMFEQPWLGVTVPTDQSASVRLNNEQIISEGYGLIAARSGEIQNGDSTHTWDYSKGSTPATAPEPPAKNLTREIVKVYKTVSDTGNVTWDGAFYRKETSATITVEDETLYQVEEWETSRVKVKTSNPDADWDEVRVGSTKTQSGADTSTVILNEEETTLYVLLVRRTDATTVSLQATNDAIQSWELNFVFQNFSGSRTGNKEGFAIDILNMYKNAQHKGEHAWSMDSTFSVIQDIAGDLFSYKQGNVLLYNTLNGAYSKFLESKTFSTNADIAPQYAYNISRGLWGDNLVLSSWRGITAENASATVAYRNYAKNYLGIETGATTTPTSVSAGINIDNTVSAKKQDTYTFSGSATERWEELKYDSNGDPYYESRSSNINLSSTYLVDHFLNKYKVKNIGVVSNPKAGQIAYTGTSGTGGAVLKQILASENTETLSLYPEVEYIMHYQNMNSDSISPQEEKVFALGEYLRQAKPALLSGYRFGVVGNAFSGSTTLPSASTGTNASRAAEKFGDTSINGVTAQGTTFETAVTSMGYLDIYTYSLDIQDEVNGVSVNAIWGNEAVSTAALAEHEAYAKALANSIEPHLYMQGYSDKTNISATGPMYELAVNISNTKITSPEVIQTINLVYKDGKIVNKQDIVDSIKVNYALSDNQALQTYNNWGIEQQLDAMLVSSSDADNRSTGQWYDEETITLCIKVYYSRVKMGQIMADDKIDYNTIGMNASNRMANGNAVIQMRFFVSFSFEQPSVEFSGNTFELPEWCCYQAEVSGTKFLVANLTTMK